MASHWTDLLPRAWLLITQEGKPNPLGNVGNFGYEDIAEEAYRYDSLVGNSKQLSVGDIILLRDHTHLLGMGRISKIDQKEGTKALNRCPSCSRTTIKERKEVIPRFRCGLCKSEFSDPILDHREVIKYTAWYGEGYISMYDSIPVRRLREALASPRSQQSISRLDYTKLLTLLLQTSIEFQTPNKPSTDNDIPKAVPISKEKISKENLIPLTEDMIPLSSEGASSNGEMIRIIADGLPAQCYIDDSRPSSRIELLFDEEHDRFHDYFSTKYFLFEEPGVMKWGHGEEPMQIFTHPNQGKQAQSQPGYFSLTISATQLRKSTINANRGIRDALLENRLIDYKTITPGRSRRKACRLIFGGKVIETKASFLIPKRRGETSPEPRFWPYKLNRHTKPETKLHFLATATRLIVSDSPENLES